MKRRGEMELAFLDQMDGLGERHAMISECFSDTIYQSLSGVSTLSVSLVKGSRGWL